MIEGDVGRQGISEVDGSGGVTGVCTECGAERDTKQDSTSECFAPFPWSVHLQISPIEKSWSVPKS